jgi:hypothetical protein
MHITDVLLCTFLDNFCIVLYGDERDTEGSAVQIGAPAHFWVPRRDPEIYYKDSTLNHKGWLIQTIITLLK